MSDYNPNHKRCRACNNNFPLIDTFWHRNSSSRDGYQRVCKICAIKLTREWRKNNPKHKQIKRKNEIPTSKICSVCRGEYALTSEFWHKDRTKPFGYSYVCKQCSKAQDSYYYQKNREKIIEKQREYQKNNPEKHRESSKRWRENHLQYDLERQRRNAKKNAAKRREYAKRFRNTEHGKQLSQVVTARYTARKKSLPDSFAKNDWEYAVNFFDGCCAACGRQLKDLFGTHTAAMDHWIPLSASNCPGTIPENIIPLCHGQNGCNNSKHDRDPIEWLYAEFPRKKADAILKRINRYFGSLTKFNGHN